MNVWFTSDTHYAHRNIVGPSISSWSKGFRNFESLDQMNNALVTNINKYVKKGDTLYHLGDFSFGNKSEVIEFRNKLICENIHLIFGNHDEDIIKYEDLKSLFTSTQHVFNGYIGKTKFHLSHYAHRVWPQSHKGCIHLYGHSHGSIDDYGRSMDIGIDCHKDFRPFHINEILSIMNNKEIN